ncbi:MAG: AAA family ATPase [Bacteroidota bacterium]|nr:AAA family ATPase [Bacteroidota bacterium]
MAYSLNNINGYKRSLDENNVAVFSDTTNSYRDFLFRIKVNSFRHIRDLDISFDSPVTIISGGNKIGKTSVLLLIACSYVRFLHIDSTKPDTLFRPFSWRDVISFTKDETDNGGYSYELFWRVANSPVKHGEGKRGEGKQSWTGLGKLSHTGRVNAKIMNREVRFIDLDRIHPARGCSRRLNFKASHSRKQPLAREIVDCYKYIFRIAEDINIFQTGSHINKRVYLIERVNGNNREAYSSFNDASGEEALLNMLVDMWEAGDNALLLIDELECGIHPETQRRLADIIQYFSWVKKQQYIITTHSATLLSAFPQKSRKLIEVNHGVYSVISKPAVETVFSKLDSEQHPLVRLYCEDEIAAFCLKKLLIRISEEKSSFSKLINVVRSGPADKVRSDYERHKVLYSQMIPRQGYCCVFDGDMRNQQGFRKYIGDDAELVFFLPSDQAPELFLCEAYLNESPNEQLQAFIRIGNHHDVFNEMVRLGIAVSRDDALATCWQAFSRTGGFDQFYQEFRDFMFKVVVRFTI